MGSPPRENSSYKIEFEGLVRSDDDTGACGADGFARAENERIPITVCCEE